MRTQAIAVVLGFAGMAAAVTASASGAAPLQQIDRVVAVVDEEPILDSDVEQTIGLGFLERKPGESDQALRRRVIEGLIEQRLRFHEVDRFGFTEVPLAEVEIQLKGIRARFASESAFQQRLQDLGMNENGLRQLLARQLMVLTYVEERLGARIFVGVDDIRAYYDTVLVPEMKKENKPVPILDDVREQARRVLRERRLNEEIGRWTETLRRQADVTNLADKVHAEPPPIQYEIAPKQR